MRDLTFRPASARDSDFAYQVKKAAFREYVEKVWGWDEEEQRQLHEKRFIPNLVQVLQVSGIEVGVLCVAREPHCVNVRQLFILPEHQGRGIGKACMLRLIREAEAWGLPIRLQVFKVNCRALAFYKRLGFGLVGDTPTHTQMERPVMARPPG